VQLNISFPRTKKHFCLHCTFYCTSNYVTCCVPLLLPYTQHTCNLLFNFRPINNCVPGGSYSWIVWRTWTINVRSLFVRKPEGKKSLVWSRLKLEKNIVIDLKDAGWEDVECLHLSQIRDKWLFKISTEVGDCLKCLHLSQIRDKWLFKMSTEIGDCLKCLHLSQIRDKWLFKISTEIGDCLKCLHLSQIRDKWLFKISTFVSD